MFSMEISYGAVFPCEYPDFVSGGYLPVAITANTPRIPSWSPGINPGRLMMSPLNLRKRSSIIRSIIRVPACVRQAAGFPDVRNPKPGGNTLAQSTNRHSLGVKGSGFIWAARPPIR